MHDSLCAGTFRQRFPNGWHVLPFALDACGQNYLCRRPLRGRQCIWLVRRDDDRACGNCLGRLKRWDYVAALRV